MISLFGVYFIILLNILTADGIILDGLCGCTKQPDPCDCINPVLINPPTNIVQCLSRFKFDLQVKENFNLQYKELVQDYHQCDYTEYKKILRGVEKVTKEIIGAYFQCRERNCTTAILEAYKNYENYSNSKYIRYMLCAYATLSPECAAKINFAAFSSVENILTTLLTCAKLKAEFQRPKYRLLFTFTTGKKECNCIKTGMQPIPESEEYCFSPEFLKRLKCYIADSFTQIKESYHNASIANPQCNYSEFEEKTKEMKNMAVKWLDILEDCHPTFEKFYEVRVALGDNARELNAAVRRHILESDEECSIPVRTARQSSLSVLNYVFQALMKCVQYKEPAANSICLPKDNCNDE